jgi:dihydrofolate synthase/folylpolyglutamate synthase
MQAGLPIPAMRGDYQLNNAACTLMAFDCLAERFPVTAADLRAGLTRTVLPGRFQTLPGRPLVVLDVAHNVEAAQALARTLAMQPVAGRTVAVVAMLRDKPMVEVLRVLAPQIAGWYVAGLEGSRGAGADELLAALAHAGVGGNIHAHRDVGSAYAAAQAAVGIDDRIVVFGSFHTVGAILRAQSKS